MFKSFPILAALVVAFFVALPSAVLAQQKVDKIQVVGNERVEDSTIILQLSSKAGGAFDAEKVEADVKTIYQTGYFDQVIAKLEDHGPSVVTVIFQVVERPAIRQVLLQGNEKVDDEALKEKLNIAARRFLDRKKILAGIEAAKAHYQGKGYYGTEITYLTAPVEKNQVDLTFVVKEGEKKVIRELVFEGNQAFDSSELEDVVKTTTYSWYSSWLTGSGIVNKEQLDNDVRELTKFYLGKGYVDIKITAPSVDEQEESLRVTFKVEEGNVYQFNEITASGTLLGDSVTRTLEGVESKQGETFDVEKLRRDTFSISEKFTDIGFAFTNVEPLTNINRDEKTVDVDFKVSKGPKVAVDRVNISGNKKTQDNVIRRSVVVQEQQTFSSSKIKRSQELLQRLGYFEEVTITPEPGDNQDEVDLNVAVREAQTGTFSIGGGISSGEGFIFSSRIAENNLFGTGNSLSLDGNTGTRRQNAVLSFNNPRVNDTKWALGTDLLSIKRELDDFDKREAGGAFSVGHPLSFLGEELEDDVNFGMKYQLVDVKIDDIDPEAAQLIKDSEGSSVSSSITPRLVRNTINNPLDPETGSRQLMEVEVAGLGGDEEFWLFQGSNTWYTPVWDSPLGKFVFSQRTRLDYGDSYNDDPFPLFRRFFAGGINSVRGYKARKLGPKDENGSFYGGSKQLIANFEMIFPLFQSIGLRGVAFYDVGNAFDDEEDIEIGELRQAVGFGFRWKTPIAPIRIEFGFPLDSDDGDRSLVTNFSFGSPL